MLWISFISSNNQNYALLYENRLHQVYTRGVLLETSSSIDLLR